MYITGFAGNLRLRCGKEGVMEDRMKILIAWDGSECAEAALEDLKRAGLPHNADAIVLTVTESWLPPPSSPELLEAVDRRLEAQALARGAALRLGTMMPGWNIGIETGFGVPAEVILDKAAHWKPDLIVAGSHGRSAMGRFFFGSVSQKLVHEAECSVRVARGKPRDPGSPVRLVIGVDGSKGAEAAIRTVAAREWPKGSSAHLVSAAWTVPPAVAPHMVPQIAEWIANENARVSRMVEEATGRLSAAGLVTSNVTREEDPKRLLLAEAEGRGADCIFVGARGITALERFMIGSVSSAVAARAHCSVEIVRSFRPGG
jgi:nucleotide-binding universal stress UspA family protein